MSDQLQLESRFRGVTCRSAGPSGLSGCIHCCCTFFHSKIDGSPGGRICLTCYVLDGVWLKYIPIPSVNLQLFTSHLAP